ncbi:MAG: hypothetical protein H8E14_05280 [Candidatus Marinimicrobia bacterium]|nr:hypothetical protein [Candidatus Neomarinimicrobiota bacterium]
MKNTLRLLTLLFLGISVIFFIGCEEDTDDVSPLVGTWTMSNMEQSSTYLAAEDAVTQGYGFAIGDTIGSGAMVWAQFSELGVNADVVVKDDDTFTLVGNLPSANDTLGVAPTIVPLTDSGVWTHDETAGTFILDGGLYDLGGVLTLDDPDDPTTMTLVYSELDEDLAKVVVHPTYGDLNVLIDEHSATTLGFTKQ